MFQLITSKLEAGVSDRLVIVSPDTVSDSAFLVAFEPAYASQAVLRQKHKVKNMLENNNLFTPLLPRTSCLRKFKQSEIMFWWAELVLFELHHSWKAVPVFYPRPETPSHQITCGPLKNCLFGSVWWACKGVNGGILFWRSSGDVLWGDVCKYEGDCGVVASCSDTCHLLLAGYCSTSVRWETSDHNKHSVISMWAVCTKPSWTWTWACVSTDRVYCTCFSKSSAPDFIFI